MQQHFRFSKVCAKNGRNAEPCRGSAAAVLGPVPSPPISTTGLLRSPEQVTYLFSVSVFPAYEWVWSRWKREEFHKGRVQLCNSTEIKVAAELPLPFLLFWDVGREESTQTFLFAPEVFLWVLHRISPGWTRWAIREIIDNAFNLAGGFLSFKLSVMWAVCNTFCSCLLSWALNYCKPSAATLGVFHISTDIFLVMNVRDDQLLHLFIWMSGCKKVFSAPMRDVKICT